MSISRSNLGYASNPLFWNILPASPLDGRFYGDQGEGISSKSLRLNILVLLLERKLRNTKPKIAAKSLLCNILHAKYLLNILPAPATSDLH
jgi:hypothetical protein